MDKTGSVTVSDGDQNPAITLSAGYDLTFTIINGATGTTGLQKDTITIDAKTKKLWLEISAITRAMEHKIQSPSKSETDRFAINMLTKIGAVENKEQNIRLDRERAYFNALLGGQKDI